MPEGNASGKLRILHVTEAAGGGVLRHLDYIIPGLQAKGRRCACLVFSARADEERLGRVFSGWRKAGAEARFLSLPGDWLRRIGCWRRIRRELSRLIREFRPDVVHLHSSLAGGVGRLLMPFCGFRGRVMYSPHAFHWHPDMDWRPRTAAAWAERLLALRTDRFILVGHGEIDQGNRMGIPWRNRCEVAVNGLPRDFTEGLLSRARARERLGIPEGEFAVVVPGRLAWQKGQAELLRMLERTSLPDDCGFYFCGADARRMQERLPLAAHPGTYRFLDEVRGLDRAFPAFDLGILPSRYEGLSYALLEMLAAGVPVLGSDILENRLVRRRIPDPETRLRLWKDPAGFESLLRRSFERGTKGTPGGGIAGLFSLERQVEDLCRIYSG